MAYCIVVQMKMVSDKKSVFSPIGPDTLAKAKESIGESEERLEQTIVIIREWLRKQTHLTCPNGTCLFNTLLTKNSFNYSYYTSFVVVIR